MIRGSVANRIKEIVQSVNGLFGNITLTSSGGTVTITTPTADTINLESSGGGGAVDSVNGQTGVVVLDTGDIADVVDSRYVTDAQLVVIGNTSGTNTGDVTVTDSSEIDFTLTGQNITASLIAGSIDETKLDASVNASLDLADTALQVNQTITISGDITGSGATSITTTLATVNSNVGSFGSATQVAVPTVNAKGLITAISNTSIAIPSTAVTDFTEAAQDACGAMTTDGSLVYVDATPLLTRGALTGDITAAQGSNATTLATVNANVGSFGSATAVGTFTVNGKGLITAASDTAIQITESQVTNLVSDLAAKQPLDATLTSIAAVSGVQGDLLYASGTDTWTRLAKDANATRYLSNQGTSNNPAWAQVNVANGVTGRLPFANLTQGSARSVLGVTGNATANVASIQGTANQALVVNSAGTALAFGQVNLASSAAVTGDLPLANLAPSSSASRLLGRGDASAGDYQEITLGAGLSMSGTTLTGLSIPSTAVYGGGSSTDNAITRWDGASGTLVQDSNVIVDDSGNVRLPTGAGLRTGTSAGNTFLLQAYDVDGAAYTTFGTLTANNTPTFALSGISVDNSIIGGSTPAAANFGSTTNYASISSAGNLVFNGAAQYLLNLDQFAFAVNGLATTGIKFRFFTGVPGYVTTDLAGADIASIDVSGTDSVVNAVYGFANGITSPASIGANQNNYAGFIAGIVRLTSSGAYNITGAVAPTNSRAQQKYIYNIGANNITLTHEDAASTAANRFRNTTLANIVLGADEGAICNYDTVTARWRCSKL